MCELMKNSESWQYDFKAEENENILMIFFLVWNMKEVQIVGRWIETMWLRS